MLRRTFAKTILVSLSLPIWPFPILKSKVNNSDLIKRLLDEGKNFSITTDDGMKFNIIRRSNRLLRKEGDKLSNNRTTYVTQDFQQSLCERLNSDKSQHKEPYTKIRELASARCRCCGRTNIHCKNSDICKIESIQPSAHNKFLDMDLEDEI